MTPNVYYSFLKGTAWVTGGKVFVQTGTVMFVTIIQILFSCYRGARKSGQQQQQDVQRTGRNTFVSFSCLRLRWSLLSNKKWNRFLVKILYGRHRSVRCVMSGQEKEGDRGRGERERYTWRESQLRMREGWYLLRKWSCKRSRGTSLPRYCTSPPHSFVW